MNADHILDALGDVSDAYIADAEDPIRRRRPVRWVAVLAAVLALTVALAATAAAYTDTGYAILYALSPAAAQALKPVNESCEANGVRMTVDSAVIENNTAYIRIALTDLEGNLFDGSIDLCDSYDVKKGFDASVVGGTCALEDYDEDTRTAVFLTQLAPLDGTVIRPGKVTFRVNEFSGHTEIWDSPVEGIDLTALPEAAGTVKLEGFAMNGDTGSLEYPKTDCLIPGEPMEICPGAAITGAAWVDGKLHIQVRVELFSASGIVYLTPAPEDDMEAPGAILDAVRASFFDQEPRFRYDDYVFDVTPDQVKDLTLKGWFQLMDDPTEGPWEVTFKLQ